MAPWPTAFPLPSYSSSWHPVRCTASLQTKSATRCDQNPKPTPFTLSWSLLSRIQFSEAPCAISSEGPTREAIVPWAAVATEDFTDLAAMSLEQLEASLPQSKVNLPCSIQITVLELYCCPWGTSLLSPTALKFKSWAPVSSCQSSATYEQSQRCQADLW